VNVDKVGHGAHWRRTVGQQVYSPFLIAFTHEVFSHTTHVFSVIFKIFFFKMNTAKEAPAVVGIY
jgi:hypothetical protein